MTYTEWDAVENSIRAVTRMLENRQGQVAEAPDSFQAAVGFLDAAVRPWRPDVGAGHWQAVSRAGLADLEVLTEAAALGDDSPIPSGAVSGAADRLTGLIGMLSQLDET